MSCASECLRLIYDELREATRPVTTRDLGERLMPVKAIPVADKNRRELVQKTLLVSLNRAKETIARIETRQRGQLAIDLRG